MNIKGFALLELFAVISLLSLVAAVAIPQIIEAKAMEKETRFQKAVIATFTETLNVLDENNDLAKTKGSWDCKAFEYETEDLFKECTVTWSKANPTVINLKISVTSNIDKTWTYNNKTKANIKEYPNNYS